MHGLGSGHVVTRIGRFVSTRSSRSGAGLGLLAMLGAGEKTDLGAHLFGFLAGVGLGLAVGLAAARRGVPGRGAQAWMYLAAAVIPVGAWALAWLA